MIVTALQPLGAVVSGIAVGALAADDTHRLKTLLAEHGVLVLPGQQDADDAGFLAFLRSFGAPVFTTGETPLPGFADLNVISNVGRDTPPKSNFHVDTTYVDHPPAYTALRAVRVPERGGQTVFSDQYRALATLEPDLRERLRDETMTHVVTGVQLGPDDQSSAVHPVFATHPRSGRPALYLTSAARCAAVSGVAEGDTAALIALLIAHSTREDNLLRHTWAPGDVVIWDNRCVMHKADHDGVDGDRVMHRGMSTDAGLAELSQA